VDPKKGSDSTKSGAEATPFATIAAALAALRKAGPKPKTMILRGGVHYLAETVVLTPLDSGITISGYPSGEEEAWISGGVGMKDLSRLPRSLACLLLGLAFGRCRTL
jgi:hypothetical protein